MLGRFASGGCCSFPSRSGSSRPVVRDVASPLRPALGHSVRVRPGAGRWRPVVRRVPLGAAVSRLGPGWFLFGFLRRVSLGAAFCRCHVRAAVVAFLHRHVSLALTSGRVSVSATGWWRSGRTFRLGSHSFPVRFAGTRVAGGCRPVGVTVPYVSWGGRLLGCTFLLTYVSLVVGSFWGLLFGVLVAVFLGCHIWLVVTVLVGHIWLAGRVLFGGCGQGLRVAGG